MTLPEPPEDLSLVLRTAFRDDDAWRAVCEVLRQPVPGFAFGLYFVDDQAHAGLTPAGVAELADGQDLGVVFLADERTMASGDQTIVVVDLEDEPGRWFRTVTAEVAAIQNNLNIANMDFAEFADRVGTDGIFRGFR
jgi:hypothetical protein